MEETGFLEKKLETGGRGGDEGRFEVRKGLSLGVSEVGGFLNSEGKRS